jgi:hypothetical protein
MKVKYREPVPGAVLPCLAATREVEAELLPCPLCGVDGEQLLVPEMVCCEAQDLDDEQARGKWAVQCGNCGLVLPGWAHPDLAVQQWNDRTEARP